MGDDVQSRCTACANLLLEPSLQKPHFTSTHYTSIEEIQSGADKGCESCRVLLQLILPRRNEDVAPLDISLNVAQWPRGNLVVFMHSDKIETNLFLEMFVLPGTHCPWADTYTSYLVSGDTSSDPHLESARVWLEKCDSNHALCRSTTSSEVACPKLPKRVLDVTPFEESGSVRLVEITDEVASYLCLSHCWGTSSQPLRTTKSNISEWKRQIPWDKLPKTFQDAVDFVRRLGHRYLWIDSLCIIQDDPEDWEEQSIQMATIYRNSYLTLAALWARDSTDGLYYVGNDYSATSAEVCFPNMEPFTVYCRQNIFHWSSPHTATSDLFPLIFRAWVLQERLLSPRVLYFNQAELEWHCYEYSTCECTRSIEEQETESAMVNRERLVDVDLRPGGRAVLWRNIVQIYSELNITNPNDCLPALQGIGKHLLQDRSHRIISGLWEETLLSDLCWQTTSHARSETNKDYDAFWPPRRPEQWRSPTWSWASVCSKILYLSPSTVEVYLGGSTSITAVATIRSVDIVDKNDGRAIVIAKSMSLSVSMVPGIITYPTDNTPSSDGGYYNIKYALDDSNGIKPDSDWLMWFVPDWDYTKFTDVHHSTGQTAYNNYLPNGTMAYCAHIGTIHREWYHDVEYGIVVLPADESNSVFYRVGCYRTSHWIGPEHLGPEQRPRIVYPQPSYLRRKFDGIEKRTITLI